MKVEEIAEPPLPSDSDHAQLVLFKSPSFPLVHLGISKCLPQALNQPTSIRCECNPAMFRTQQNPFDEVVGELIMLTTLELLLHQGARASLLDQTADDEDSEGDRRKLDCGELGIYSCMLDQAPVRETPLTRPPRRMCVTRHKGVNRGMGFQVASISNTSGNTRD